MGYSDTIRCSKCKFYQISWDFDKPYGCNKFGFKTRIEPSVYVNQVSGNNCKSFILKVIR